MPVSKLSHLMAFQFFGSTPGIHHLLNLFLHTANVLLVFYILRRWTQDPWLSLAAAALFAIHPVQVESVAWVSARKDLLSALFGLLTVWLYQHPSKNRPNTRLALICFLYFLSLGAKPALITLPFLLAMLDKKISRKLLPLFAISAIFCFITWSVQAKAAHYIHPTPLIFRAMVTGVFYLGKVLFPYPLAIYGRVPAEAIAFWKIAGSATLLFSISLFLYLRRKKYPLAIFGWCWFVLCLAPALILEVPADRYLYMALLGILIAVLTTFPKKWVRPLAIAAIGACIPLAYFQTGYWKNSATLFQHALAINEKNYTAHGNLAETLVSEKKYEEAAAHYFRALELNPQNTEALTSLGVLFEKENALSRAEEYHRKALRIEPGSAQTHFNLANVLEKEGKKPEALEQFFEAIKLKPDFAQSYLNAAELLVEEGKTEEAISNYKAALQIQPSYTAALNNLGLLLVSQGRYPEAISNFSKILKSDPSNVEARNNLAITLIKSGDLKTAAGHLEKIVQEHPESQEARANLKRLYSKIEHYS